jgi:hypothetical protein
MWPLPSLKTEKLETASSLRVSQEAQTIGKLGDHPTLAKFMRLPAESWREIEEEYL